MDGFRVLPMRQAAKVGNIFITVTGNINVIAKEHFLLMQDKSILANAGHFDVEIQIKSLKALAKTQRQVKPLITEFVLGNEKRIFLLGDGRLVNLACAEGHPAEVMDLSFANQALSCEYIARNRDTLAPKVYKVPDVIDYQVAKLKLTSLGITIDRLSKQQHAYLNAWQEGT